MRKQLSDFLMLNVSDEVVNVNANDLKTSVQIVDGLVQTGIVNQPTQEIVPAYKAKLFLSTKEFEKPFSFLTIKSLNDNKHIFTDILNFENFQPMNVYNFENRLYTSFYDILIDKNALDNDNLSYAVESNIDDPIYESNLVFESITDTKSQLPTLNFDLKIDDYNFILIKPKSFNNSESFQHALERTYGDNEYYNDIKIVYHVNCINQHGTNIIYTISNNIDKFGDVSFAPDLRPIVDSVDDLPVKIIVTMEIHIDDLLLTRTNSLFLNHRIRVANEVINNLPITDLVTKEIVEKVEIVNQKIVDLPDNVDPVFDVLKMNTPIFGSILTFDVDIDKFKNNKHLTFESIKNINLPPDSKLALKLNDETIYGYYTSNHVVYFNTTEFAEDYSVDDQFEIILFNNLNGESQIQTLANGTLTNKNKQN